MVILKFKKTITLKFEIVLFYVLPFNKKKKKDLIYFLKCIAEA